MESTLQNPVLVAAQTTFNVKTITHAKAANATATTRAKTTPDAATVVYWIATALLCLQMVFTAYAQLRLPQVADAFTRMGFPDYFRVELSWAKLLGVPVLLAPVSSRLKEWVYAGFAITLVSALIAHLAVGDGPNAWGFAAGTGVLWALSYGFWIRRQTPPATAGSR